VLLKYNKPIFSLLSNQIRLCRVVDHIFVNISNAGFKQVALTPEASGFRSAWQNTEKGLSAPVCDPFLLRHADNSATHFDDGLQFWRVVRIH